MKNTRGVQQEEVSVAADALLAKGLRPTIERVRQQLGRGSPNTVGPMLEIWFGSLGKRLGVSANDGGEGQIPAAAAQAFAQLWDASLLLARKEADAALAQDMRALSDSRTALTERETALVQQERAFTQRQQITDQLLQAERDRAAAAELGLATARKELVERDAAVHELRTALEIAQGQVQAARDRSEAQEQRHSEERTKLEERAAGNERRLLGEIDRERQSTKEATAAAEEATGKLQALRTDMESRTAALGQKLHLNEMELANSRHALELSESRATELSVQLQEQRTAHDAVREQLNQALAAMTRVAGSPKRKSAAARETGN